MGELQAGKGVFRSASEAEWSSCRAKGRLWGQGWSGEGFGGLVRPRQG